MPRIDGVATGNTANVRLYRVNFTFGYFFAAVSEAGVVNLICANPSSFPLEPVNQTLAHIHELFSNW